MKKLAFASSLVLLLSSVHARAEPTPSTEPHHTAAPWVVVGIGAGVAAIGVLSFVGAVKAHADARDEAAAKGCTTSPDVVCPPGVDATTLKTNVDGEHAMNIIGVIMTAAGGSALVAGLVWHFLEPTTKSKSAFVLQPVLTPTQGRLTLSVDF